MDYSSHAASALNLSAFVSIIPSRQPSNEEEGNSKRRRRRRQKVLSESTNDVGSVKPDGKNPSVLIFRNVCPLLKQETQNTHKNQLPPLQSRVLRVVGKLQSEYCNPLESGKRIQQSHVNLSRELVQNPFRGGLGPRDAASFDTSLPSLLSTRTSGHLMTTQRQAAAATGGKHSCFFPVDPLVL